MRIYLGSEPAQYRAERVFVWSVKKHRDLSRRYEIYLMKDLEGFDRSKWKTGFTNYRYAIPALAGNQGRAIYNDVDQIYLADPAELFDAPMGEAAVLSINDKETSVMLLDCEKLAPLWRLEETQRLQKHKHLRALVHDAGLWGHIGPAFGMPGITNMWPGRASFITRFCIPSPGRPSRSSFATARTPTASCGTRWSGKRTTQATPSSQKPSPAPATTNSWPCMPPCTRKVGRSRDMLPRTPSRAFPSPNTSRRSRSFSSARIAKRFDFGAGKGQLLAGRSGPARDAPQAHGRLARRFRDLLRAAAPATPPSDPYEGTYDGVISTDVLEHIPEEDIPWVLDDLFAQAKTFIYAVAACYPAKKIMPDGTNAHCTNQLAAPGGQGRSPSPHAGT